MQVVRLILVLMVFAYFVDCEEDAPAYLPVVMWHGMGEFLVFEAVVVSIFLMTNLCEQLNLNKLTQTFF